MSEFACPWCEAAVAFDARDLVVSAVTCPECVTTVDLGGRPEEVVDLPLAA